MTDRSGIFAGDNPFEIARSWMKEAVESEINDPDAIALSTVDADGMPNVRMVLLREIEDDAFVFYTNYGSRKASEIEANPAVSLHFAWLALERQIIVTGRAERMSLAESTRYFLSRPRESRLAAWTSEQSRPIGSRRLLEEAFEQVKRRFAEGEVPLPSFGGGYRVRHETVEFWQGRANRLHDRFLYRPDGDGWRAERLQP